MAQLDLYYRPTCPFCKKVMQVIEQQALDVHFINISEDDAALQKLIKIGGKKQVPCLFIDGKPLYESAHIIEYLKEK